MTVKFTFAHNWGEPKETKEINTIEELIEIMKEYDESIILSPKECQRGLKYEDFNDWYEYCKADNYKDFSDITLTVYDAYIE